MVEQTKFLDMPLRTRRQRRLLVVLYYVLFLVAAFIGIWLGPKAWGSLFAFTLVLGGLLGGITYEAPVKAYEEIRLPIAMSDGTQTLNLSGRKENRAWTPLDERERTERNQAHYTAYRILRWTVGGAAFLYGCSLTWAHPGSAWDLGKELPLLAWVLVVYVLSLPQSVVLWTESESPAQELTEVRKGAR